MKHTKGEWKIFWRNYIHGSTINIDTKTRICTIEASLPNNGHAKEWEANTRLISAAPDLLDGCIEAKTMIRNICNGTEKRSERECQSILDSVIKKATE
jgi:hypothetical protein